MLRDLLLPATDAGAAAQAAGAAALFGAALHRVRRHRERRVFVAGLATFTLALLALRAVH